MSHARGSLSKKCEAGQFQKVGVGSIAVLELNWQKATSSLLSSGKRPVNKEKSEKTGTCLSSFCLELLPIFLHQSHCNEKSTSSVGCLNLRDWQRIGHLKAILVWQFEPRHDGLAIECFVTCTDTLMQTKYAQREPV